MSNFGSTPQFNSWRFFAVNVENQAATGFLSMPENGVVTAVVFYANSDPASSPTNFVGCCWDAVGNLICSGSVVSVGAGSESTGGQSWITSGGISQFIAAGTQFRIGWTRAASGSMLFSLDVNGVGYVDSGGNPGPFLAPEPVGSIGAYIVYTPVQAPTATTDGASGITASGATLNGHLTPNGLDTTYYFQWGPTTSYGNQTASADAGTGTSNVNVSAALTGLAAATTYHYRLVAVNAAGTTYGADQSFSTGGTPQAPTLVAPANNSTQPLSISGQTFSWTYHTGGAAGGQTGYAIKFVRSDTGATQWWNGSAWVTTETFISSAAGSVTIGAANFVANISYTWTVANQDAGGTGPYATPFNVIAVGAPAAPTLLTPASASYADLQNTAPTFSWTYNATNATGGQTAWALRRKISGASTYLYWNASSLAWQSSIIWNSGAIQSYTFPAGSFTDGNTYNWSVATQDAGGQGPFAADFSIVAQAPPLVTVTAPNGTITATSPTVLWSVSFPTGASQTAYQVRTFTLAQVNTPGFNPAISTATDDSGPVIGAATSYQIATRLIVGTPYRTYVNVVETGGEGNGFNAYASFTATLDLPPTPTLAVLQTNDPGTGCPRLTLTATCPLNLLTAVDSSFETGIGSFSGETCTIAQSGSKFLDGLFSLQMTCSATNATMRTYTTEYPVTPGLTYVAMASMLPAATIRNVFVQIDWHSASHGYLSTTAAQPIAETSTSVWTESQISGVAPVNAAYALVIITIQNPVNGEVHYVDEVGLFLGSTFVFGTTYGSGAQYGGGAVYGGSAWSLGGLIATAQIVILRSDGVYVRGASPANPATVSPTTLQAIVSDYEAVPQQPYTYTASLIAQESNSQVQSAFSQPAGASLITTKWWELDPTNVASAVSAQPIQFNPSNTEQSAAHTVLGQATMNIVAYAMQNTDMTAVLEVFTVAIWNAILALALSQKTIWFSSPFGAGYYFRIAPAPGGGGSGTGNKAHDSQLLPSTSASPHRTLSITGVAQPRPPV